MIEFEATTKNTRKLPVISTRCSSLAAATDLPSVCGCWAMSTYTAATLDLTLQPFITYYYF